MGLTIHYDLRSTAESADQARELITQLRQRALDLPFAEVGPLVELAGQVCDSERLDRDDPHRWLLIQAGQYIDRPAPGGGNYSYQVAPTHIIAFESMPGEGCEPANVGLCRYPATIEIQENERYVPNQGLARPKRRLRTNLAGWRWSSFCKTQYASDPSLGGVGNFLRCHLLVIQMLDHAQSLGMLENVSDEGGYWEKRDIEALVKEIGSWNEMLAAAFGKLKDQFAGQVEAAIFAFPNFEHLEAKGRSKEADHV